MRHWYIITDVGEEECEFVSVDIMKIWVWLKIKGITFKVVFTEISDYQEAKGGVVTCANAMRNNTIKLIKIVFK